MCVAAKLERGHVCQDQWGEEHSPDDLDRLTLEHVKDAAAMGVKSPTDEAHCVALCFDANAVTMWGSANRQRLRDYLAGVRSMQAVS
jgi:hypothetical protein